MDKELASCLPRARARNRDFDAKEGPRYHGAPMRIEVHPEHPEPRKIRRAVEALRSGEVIAYPTDTVYALGCDPLDRKSLARLHSIKRMPADQPLALVRADLSQVAEFAQLDNQQFPHLAARVAGAVLHHPARDP